MSCLPALCEAHASSNEPALQGHLEGTYSKYERLGYQAKPDICEHGGQPKLATSYLAQQLSESWSGW